MSFCIKRSLIIMLVTGALAASASADNIYRTVDENGNTVYTDRQPTPDAKPIRLRELSVVEAVTYAPPASASTAQNALQDGMTVDQMRRRYRGCRLVSPAPDQDYWGTGNIATLAWDAGEPLMDGMQVIFYVDDVPSAPTRAAPYTTERLDRGLHQARAELLDRDNRVIATTDAVPFNIHQQSVRQQRAVPLGGG